MKRAALFLILLVMGGMTTVWSVRNPLVRYVLNRYAFPLTGLSGEVKTVEVIPWSWRELRFVMEGTVEGAPWDGTATLQTLRRELEDIELRVRRFPLPAANREGSKRWGLLFEKGTADLRVTGTATPSKLGLHADVTLYDFSVRPASANPPADVVDAVNYLDKTGARYRLPIQIRGSPRHPHVITPLDLLQGLRKIKLPSGGSEKTGRFLKKFLRN